MGTSWKLRAAVPQGSGPKQVPKGPLPGAGLGRRLSGTRVHFVRASLAGGGDPERQRARCGHVAKGKTICKDTASPRGRLEVRIAFVCPAAPTRPHGDGEQVGTRLPPPTARLPKRRTLPAASCRSLSWSFGVFASHWPAPSGALPSPSRAASRGSGLCARSPVSDHEGMPRAPGKRLADRGWSPGGSGVATAPSIGAPLRGIDCTSPCGHDSASGRESCP